MTCLACYGSGQVGVGWSVCARCNGTGLAQGTHDPDDGADDEKNDENGPKHG